MTDDVLKGKVVLITGAGSGLGEATARLMAAEGGRVVLADIQDDRGRALAAAREAGAEVRGNDFLDPWGNRVQVVEYADVQFTKAPPVLEAMGLAGLEKSASALEELRRKGIDA